MTKRIQLPVLREESASEDARVSAAPELPSISQATLDWESVDCVLADLDDFTDIHELLARVASGTPKKVSDLVDARDRLVAGEFHGIQMTYDFADQVWIDTLLREPGGTRRLRMAAPDQGKSF